jgi:predicted nucleotidyltransferase
MDKHELKKHICACFAPFQPQKILLFGSWARNQHDSYSDVDIIVVYETQKRFMDRLQELYMSWDLPLAVDILAYTPEEFDVMRKESSFVQDAIKEGEVIYEHAAQGSPAMACPSRG